jgi:hypothetical protein
LYKKKWTSLSTKASQDQQSRRKLLIIMMRSLLLQLPFLGAVLAQTSGKFNTMTCNVAGLPPVLNGNDIPGDKDTNTALLGKLFTQYNISLIHVQEDFVSFAEVHQSASVDQAQNFHATLYANDKHPFRTPTSGGVPFGSGLNSLSNYEYTAFERVKWNTCSTFE